MYNLKSVFNLGQRYDKTIEISPLLIIERRSHQTGFHSCGFKGAKGGSMALKINSNIRQSTTNRSWELLRKKRLHSCQSMMMTKLTTNRASFTWVPPSAQIGLTTELDHTQQHATWIHSSHGVSNALRSDCNDDMHRIIDKRMEQPSPTFPPAVHNIAHICRKILPMDTCAYFVSRWEGQCLIAAWMNTATIKVWPSTQSLQKTMKIVKSPIRKTQESLVWHSEFLTFSYSTNGQSPKGNFFIANLDLDWSTHDTFKDVKFTFEGNG